MIYFDNSATTYPKPQGVMDAVKEAIAVYGGNPGRGGHALSMRTADKVFSVRAAVGEMFHTEPENVVFTENCTMSLNLALQSIPGGADVITSDSEHNAVSRVLYAEQKAGRISYRILDTGQDNAVILPRLQKMLRPDTKAVVMTAASNVTGRVFPVHEVGAFCKEHGLLFIVDGAQAAGIIPLDMEADNIDMLCMSGHKGLYGITGTGLLLSRGAVSVHPLLYGGTGTASLDLLQPELLPEGLESGTLPTVGICSLAAGMTYINEQGMERLTKRSLGLCKNLYDALCTMPQVKLYSEKPVWGNAVPIVSFTVDGYSSEDVALVLNEAGFALRGGYQCAALTHKKLHTEKVGVVRFSPGCFNTEKEVSDLVQTIKNMCYPLKNY